MAGHKGDVSALLTRDNWLLSCSKDTSAKLWNLSTGQCLRSYGEGGGVPDVARTISNLQALGRPLASLPNHFGPVLAGDLCPESRRVLTCSDDTTARLWSFDSSECLQVLEGHSKQVSGVCFCGPRQAVTGSRDTTVRLWDLSNGRCLRVGQVPGAVSALAWCEEMGILAVGLADGRLLWLTLD